jgi:hypothetical protein
MRVIVRREHPRPGAQLSQFESNDGYRYQAFTTNTRIGHLGFLELMPGTAPTPPSRTGSRPPRTRGWPSAFP